MTDTRTSRPPDYRNVPCPNCHRERLQWNGICEKCEWDADGGDYASITGRCTLSPSGSHEWVPGNNIMGPPFNECKYCHIDQGQEKPSR